ncbi:MAG: prepilin-type N-terminal cleavage/methylation domain-containing protein [Longimicrobiales bacterium]|jgi:general secretion pathway protein G|uniref:Pilin n=1 Tax=marine metagenome TaxID=408172 RepID=A0A381NG34_9ZZZZ|nr:prepilin-type N-terminal cleavage/methylation domain-containing protein [Longimicrobiales bacterium]MEC7807510.1 prepilin-type N-terminal cleavage/methylation domain-containing protein [Gemmatimonadota bacterium]|tara:strand:- start:30 stop:422 length:393 start_codon:yes stop_codon:yes gene_type:complete
MSNKQGFTLTELLIVIVILGILAALAIPKVSNMTYRSYFAAMEADLKNLASQQEIYYASEYSYTAEKSDLAFISSRDVSISVNADSEGWSATATHVALEPIEGCSIYHGSIPTPTLLVPPSAPDEVACTR